MLNTDAHNPNVKRRMTLPEFIKNNRGINNKGDLPEEFLKKLYTSIVTYEIRLSDDDIIGRLHEEVDGISAAFAQPHRRHVQTFEGVKEIKDLFERSPSKTDRVVYVLSDCLLVTAAATAKKTKNSFRYLFNCIKMRVLEVNDSPMHKNVVEVVNPTGRLIFLIFPNSDDKSAFISVLRQQIAEVAAMPEAALEKLRTFTTDTASKALMSRSDSSDSNLPKRMGTLTKLWSTRVKRTGGGKVGGDQSDSPLPQTVLKMTGQVTSSDLETDLSADSDAARSAVSLNTRVQATQQLRQSGLIDPSGAARSGSGSAALLTTPRRPVTAALPDLLQRQLDDDSVRPDSASERLSGRRPSVELSISDVGRSSNESDRSSIDDHKPPEVGKLAGAACAPKWGG